MFSLWPIIGSVGAFLLTSGRVYWWHNSFSIVFYFSVIVLIFTMLFWWRDIIKEGIMGNHSRRFKIYLRRGIILFILSEVCFFASFFWGFFHMCWSPSEELGVSWPPYIFNEIMVDPFSVPLLKTIILLSSGVSVTASHFYIIRGVESLKTKLGLFFLFFTVVLGFIFLYLQLEEYMKSFISFNRRVYGSAFFILTGFHGLHVTIGAIMLLVIFVRKIFKSFSSYDHVGFEGAAWYWHFVDVVWLFLFIFIYWLGSPL